jgi:hypothetical protein
MRTAKRVTHSLLAVMLLTGSVMLLSAISTTEAASSAASTGLASSAKAIARHFAGKATDEASASFEMAWPVALNTLGHDSFARLDSAQRSSPTVPCESRKKRRAVREEDPLVHNRRPHRATLQTDPQGEP